MESDLTREQKENLEVVEESSQVLLALINDILDLSRIEAGKLSLRETEMSIHDVAQRVVKLLTVRAEAKGLFLKLNISDNVPSILIGDSSRVAQILTNLIFNAIKFTETGGVTVSIHDEGLSADRAYLSLVVADTGIGIEADQLEAIFDSFSQAHGDISLSYGGAGLGLAISSRLARQMGGELNVVSEVGEGSSFAATLSFGRIEDLESDESLTRAKVDDSHYPALVGKHVLVVEDNEVNQQLMLKILNRRGIDTTMVEDGQLAVAQVKRNHFDVVLMDIRMPVMDGITATKQIREWEQSQASRAPVVIIALTAYAGEVNSERAAAAGVDDFITKPYRTKELLKTMNRLLS
jgi:CheY-like chemotaxis protein